MLFVTSYYSILYIVTLTFALLHVFFRRDVCRISLTIKNLIQKYLQRRVFDQLHINIHVCTRKYVTLKNYLLLKISETAMKSQLSTA